MHLLFTILVAVVTVAAEILGSNPNSAVRLALATAAQTALLISYIYAGLRSGRMREFTCSMGSAGIIIATIAVLASISNNTFWPIFVYITIVSILIQLPPIFGGRQTKTKDITKH